VFMCRLRNPSLLLPSLIVIVALATLALTIDSASARGGGGSRGGNASVRAGFAGSSAVRAAPGLHGQQGSPVRLQHSAGGAGPVPSPVSPPPGVSPAPKSAAPPASKAGILLLLLNSEVSASPSPPPTVPAAPPMPAVSAPEGQIQPVAPLSPS